MRRGGCTQDEVPYEGPVCGESSQGHLHFFMIGHCRKDQKAHLQLAFKTHLMLKMMACVTDNIPNGKIVPGTIKTTVTTRAGAHESKLDVICCLMSEASLHPCTEGDPGYQL